MKTLSALLAICVGNSPVPGEFPAQRPVTRSFDVFFNLHPNKWLSKQLWGWWFETPSRPLWRHCIVKTMLKILLNLHFNLDFTSQSWGCFTNVSRTLQNNLAKIHNTRNHIYGANCTLKLCTSAYKVSAWNFHHKYNFCNTQISREYFGELVKR